MSGFFAELKRRNVYRVAAGYVVVAWMILQVVSVVNGPLNLPPWFETIVTVLLAIGFPLALLFAWAFDLTPEGLKLTAPEHADSQTSRKGGFDYVLLAGLVVVAGVTLWSRLDTDATANPEGQITLRQTASIAVLPFTDMSQDGDQTWFGEGIADELINKLYTLEGLRVSSPTSSFSFSNSGLDIRAIGTALGVDWILEGGVRKDGDALLITPRLINPEDGLTIWSEVYNRRMTDVFSIQNEIATSVATALGIKLGVGDANSFRGAGTRNIEAYEAYLQATSSSRSVADRIAALERAITLDPNYAAAWGALGVVRGGNRMWEALPVEAPGIIEEGYGILLHAVELDPDSWQTNTSLGVLRYARREWIEAEQNFRKALALRFNDETLARHADMLARAGRTAAARARYGEAESIQLAPVGANFLIQVSIAENNLDEAREILNTSQWTAGKIDDAIHIALNDDDPGALRSALDLVPSTSTSAMALYLPILDVLDSPEEALATLRNVYSDENVQWASKLHDIALLAAYFGDPEFALEAKGEEVRNTSIRDFALWYPVMSEVRRLPGFKDLVTEVRLVDYWRAYGWADTCRPLGNDDFECG